MDDAPKGLDMVEDEIHVIERTTPYRGFFRVDAYRLRHKVFDAGWSDEMMREVLERGHAVGVLPYDPILDQVILIEQFRIGAYTAPGFSPWQIECVAGIIEPGHSAEDTAHREAKEEAGVEIRELVPIAHYLSSPGGTSETIQLFCGHADSVGVGGIHGLADEHEFVRVLTAPSDDAFRMVDDGRICNSMTIIALQWLKNHRHALRVSWDAIPERDTG